MVLPFPPRHVYFPASQTHTTTVILLHGRGCNGPELVSDLSESRTSSGKTLFAHFPSTRWVFPSAQPHYSDQLKKEVSQWFELTYVEDPDRDLRKQASGLRESVDYILKIIEEEVARLGGNPDRVILGGISQGMAIALVALLCYRQTLAGFVGAMGWIPFAGKLTSLLDKGETGRAAAFFGGSLSLPSTEPKSPHARAETSPEAIEQSLRTPIFLGHGEDDKWINVRLGEKARDILSRMGFPVCWKTYQGAEEDGHWLKEPEQFDDIVQFLESKFP
jgi:lysophospholipase II